MSLEQRRLLENVVRRARDVAERAALEDPCALWHGRLFLRFLKENALLDPQDCGQAQGPAARLLPFIPFPLPPAPGLDDLLATLPAELFRAEDSLGWAYQSWQARRKDAVNASGMKIGAAEVPVVTQLFTEDYMALFLLHNSLGAWWAGRRLGRDGQERSEDAWRDLCQVGGYRFDYLRLLPDGTPAAGVFPDWPGSARELKVLDPCLGSGHLLVLALPMLAAFRRAEEGLGEAEALKAVLAENLHGLEIDPRCCEIAAFNLALAVWKRIGLQPLPELQVACCGLAPTHPRAHWLAQAGGSRRLRDAMDRLHALFRKAPLLGSLLNPRKAARRCPEVLPLLEQAVLEPAPRAPGVRPGGPGMAARILCTPFTLVLTNVPYLTRGRQCLELAAYCDNHHPLAKGDLANAFLERMLELAHPRGTVQAVMPQNWLFLGGHKQLRQRLLAGQRWLLLARLGAGAFGSISGGVVNVALFTLSLGPPEASHGFQAIDASGGAGHSFGSNAGSSAGSNAGSGAGAGSMAVTLAAKATALSQGPLARISQLQQLDHPDSRVILTPEPATALLSGLAQGIHGFGSKDSPRFFRKFWELPGLTPDWQLMQTTVQATAPFGGNEQIVRWEQGQGLLRDLGRSGLALPAGQAAWGRKGVSVAQMGRLPATLHLGAIFDKNVAVILPHDPAHLPAIWCFCASPAFFEAVRAVDPSLKVTNATLVKVPFDLAAWQRVAESRYPDGLPAPCASDPTQWLFHGHPARADRPLHVAAARLLGYTWPAEADPSLELSPESRAWILRCEALAPHGEPSGILPLAQAPERLRALLRAAFGQDWSQTLEQALLQAEGFGGRDLEAWLREGLAPQHAKLFHQRPFLWQLGDAHPQGFSVLVNYHKLDRAALESILRHPLAAWIRGPGKGTGPRLAKALELRSGLKRILRGAPPYDLFVRWKPLEGQPMGWEPDLNDGVRINIRPFVKAGALAFEPNLHWNRDRGKDSQEVPRFLPLQGERVNQVHLSLKAKALGRRTASAPQAGVGR